MSAATSQSPSVPGCPRRPRAATASIGTSPDPRAGAVVFPGRNARLTGADLYDWIALRRVSDGGITRMGDHWFDSGFRVPYYVTDALTALCGRGLVTLVELPLWFLDRAVLTEAGKIRYQHLTSE